MRFEFGNEHDSDDESKDQQEDQEVEAWNGAPDPFFGDIPMPHEETFLRIHCLNIGGLPSITMDMFKKNDHLFTAIKQYESDIILLQELGTNWTYASTQDQWRTRVDDFLDISQVRTTTAHNKKTKVRSAHQWGGTGILARGK